MEYCFDDKGKEVKPAPSPPARNAIESDLWPKVYESLKYAGSLHTMVSTGEIPIERPHSSGSKSGETSSPLDVTNKGEDHWTFKCPYNYKDLAPQARTSVRSFSSASGPAKPPACPICMRATGGSVDNMEFNYDDTSIQVMNLSENTSDQDLYNLVCPFGVVNDFSLALDDKTGSCRKFGIVEFDDRQDAEEAVKWLNGYSFDGLTLQVEMTTTWLNEECDSPPICPTCIAAAETSVHVTSLSEDTSERDLYNLFCPFGIIGRLFLASVDKTGSGLQSGIVQFDQREDAEQAISWLNGYEYDNQMLQVKWATRAELESINWLPGSMDKSMLRP